MDAPSLEPYRVKKITPRLIEIMNRMVLGQAPKEIRKEFGITPVRFSIIINSPLFRLELKRKLLKREEIIFDIQENLLEGAKLGSQLYRDILKDDSGQPTEMKLKAANAASSFAVKLINGSNGSNGSNGGDGGPLEDGRGYEERLREVTFKETIRTVTPSQEDEKREIEAILSESYPPDETETPPDEADVLFGKMEEEEFEPQKRIEDIMAQKDESVSKNDTD